MRGTAWHNWRAFHGPIKKKSWEKGRLCQKMSETQESKVLVFFRVWSNSPKVSHRRMFNLICWQRRSANMGFYSTRGISSCGFSASIARTPFCSRAKLYTPPLPPFLATRHFPGEGGGGVYLEPPPRQEFYTSPLYTPPPRRVFSGVGGVGV